jgi:hypothetical protein
MARLDPELQKLERSIASLLKLLGGTASQRQQFWEILKGITTPAEYRLAKSSLVAVDRDITSVKDSLAAVKRAAAETRKN